MPPSFFFSLAIQHSGQYGRRAGRWSHLVCRVESSWGCEEIFLYRKLDRLFLLLEGRGGGKMHTNCWGRLQQPLAVSMVRYALGCVENRKMNFCHVPTYFIP
jgi:hypothetical protein